MSIKDWPELDRPREKLLRFGARQLSDTELLAILLRTGSAGLSAVDLARNLINKMGSLRNILTANAEKICEIKGMGPASYSQFAVISEISRRMLAEKITQHPIFTSLETITDFLRLQLSHEKIEVCIALLLNQQNQLIQTVELSRGTVNENTVYIREIATTALQHHAASLILAHNHPGNGKQPSQMDIHFTRKLKMALDILQIRLVDHFIVTTDTITSIVNNTYFKNKVN